MVKFYKNTYNSHNRCVIYYVARIRQSTLQEAKDLLQFWPSLGYLNGHLFTFDINCLSVLTYLMV